MAQKIPKNLRQQTDLLATKLEPPSLGYRVVQRTRLTALLQNELRRRVTTIVAPAGYGKTTLLVEWISTITPSDCRVAWVSLDPSDNASPRFWSYVAASLQGIFPQLHFNSSHIIRQGRGLQDFTQLNPLINNIAQTNHRICLVLDNYEAITDETIQQGVIYLIDHQPDNLHLTFSSRVPPPISQARLRVQHQLMEITEKDLSFTLVEANAFLTGAMELDLTSDKVAALLKVTEGWIVGLQLAALSMQDRHDFQPEQGHILDDNGQILAYLTEEVLNRQEPEIRDFLLNTSVLSELSAPLCDALLERTDSRDLLDRIEQANLFITALDKNRYWYRYHPLFANALRTQQEQTGPDRVITLHRKASSWLLKHGYPEKAIVHAELAGDFQKTAEILDECAMQTILDLDLPSLVQWINCFSDDLLRTHPKQGIYYAVASFILGQLDLIEPKLQVIEQALQSFQENRMSDEDKELIHWEISVIRAVLVCIQSDFTQSIPNIQELMKSTPKTDSFFLGFMNHWLAETYISIGDLDTSVEYSVQARQFASSHHLFIGTAIACCGMGRTRKEQGRLFESEQEYRRALDLATQYGKDLSIIAMAQTGLIEIALERMDSKPDNPWLKELAERYDQIETSALMSNNMGLIPLRLARFYLFYQDLESARLYFLKALDSLEKFPQSTDHFPTEFIDVQVRIWAASGELEAMQPQALEDRILSLNTTGRSSAAVQAALARIALAHHNAERTLSILTELESATRETGQGERLIETLILEALAYQENGQETQALQQIGQALHLGEPEGYVRLFIDEGEAMKALLIKVQSSGQVIGIHSYVQQLLESMDRHAHIISKKTLQLKPPLITANFIIPRVTPLTEREVEVLRMLAAGKSAKEMATTLMISVNTVKTHVKSIYRKMGAHSRGVIFQRADEMGILVHSSKTPSRFP